MNNTIHNSNVNFIWSIADDVLRDVYVRGKYRDVILPMTVLRRIDCLLEPTKETVLERDAFLEKSKIKNKDSQLTKVSGYPFYNTSKFTMRRLLDEPTNIRANFEEYLKGYSKNIQLIISKFKFHNQLSTLEDANRLYLLIQKFVSKDINLSPDPVITADGIVIHEGLSNLGMGYVFEELIRKFNEENNEEAGEHFTPRDIIQLMTHLIFEPVKDQIQSGTYLVYDDACGSGGMLTEAESFLKKLAEDAGKHVVIELYGQEVNPETFAICQADMLIKGRNPSNIQFGSTLSEDGFRGMEFDFMLANPPYGKSWKGDQDALFDEKKKYVTDQRFIVKDHPGHEMGKSLSLLPRSSDGQLLFQVNMLTKMKRVTKLGSRIAIVHNGSALFTGDAGQGESNIRQWILENDWLEAIIGLPLNMFYNTGIATYIWVLSNRKPEHRKGRVQLIDAREMNLKLRKNLGEKNCKLSDAHIEQLTKLFLDFEETPQSKIFDNADFGYHLITVERPLRLKLHATQERVSIFKASTDPKFHVYADALYAIFPDKPQKNFNLASEQFENYLKQLGMKVGKIEWKAIRQFFTEKDESAEPVSLIDGKGFEPDVELRDTERIPLKEDIQTYFNKKILPHVPDAWVDKSKTLRGYEISFTKYFYQYKPVRTLEEIISDILALEVETQGLLHKILES